MGFGGFFFFFFEKENFLDKFIASQDFQMLIMDLYYNQFFALVNYLEMWVFI